MSLRIVLTGGGTAGHVTPNIALIEILRPNGWVIDYVGSKGGVEESMMAAINIPYHAVSSGKLRRYFSWKTALDPFRILWGIVESYGLLRRLKPNVVFSKGGFVAFPVVVAAWLRCIPVVAHESDMSPGLANRLSFPFVDTLCVTFEQAKKHFKRQEKVVVTGTPIREQLFKGSKEKGLALCGFHAKMPCLLVVGGSQGAAVINKAVRQALSVLCQTFQVIHICGKGKVDDALVGQPQYSQWEYANEELADLFATSSLVVSRAGANALYELLALGKPHILVPLSERVSRGDQVQNARFFEQQGISTVIREEELTKDTLLAAVEAVFLVRDEKTAAMKALSITSGTETMVAILKAKSI